MGFHRMKSEEQCAPYDDPRNLSGIPQAIGKLTVSVLGCVLAAHCGMAQSPLLPSVNDLTQTPVPGSGHEYQKLLGETINFSNGSVSFKISFPTPASRGITIPYAWSYNSSAVNTLDAVGVTPQWNNSVNYNWPKKDGWNLADGVPWATISFFQETPPSGPPNMIMTPCNYLSGITFTDSAGVTHNLPTAAVAPSSNASNDFYQCSSTPLVVPPQGDSQAVAILAPSNGPNLASVNPGSVGNFIVLDRNGTTYQFNLWVGTGTATNQGSPAIEDRNGNFTGGSVDTSGRPGPSTIGSPATSITTGGETYSATWSKVSASYAVPYADGRSSSSNVSCQPFPGTVTSTKNVLSTLTLPNGKKYQFFYNNSYGLLSEIIFPDGGWIKYTYTIPSSYNEELLMAGYTFDSANGRYDIPQSYGCMWRYQTPVLYQRIVSYDGSTVAQTQQFSYGTTWQFASDGSLNEWSAKTTTVTTTDNILNKSAQTVYSYLPTSPASAPFQSSANAPLIPIEDTIKYYDWGNTTTPIKTVKKTWWDQLTEQSETTTVATNTGTLTSKVYYTYTSGLCNSVLLSSLKYLTQEDDYDFGTGGSPGAIIKTTKYNYTCFAASNASTYSNYSPSVAPSNWGSTYQGVVTPPKIYSVTVEDGSGHILSATQYGYDGNSLTSAAPVQFDSAYNTVPVSSGGQPIRGNLTSVTRCNPAPTAQPAQPTSSTPICAAGLQTTVTYDISGQPFSVTDPNHNTITLSFSDQFTDSASKASDSYLTNITYPSPEPGVILQKNFKYSYTTGYLTQATDENSNATSYIYNTPASNCSSSDGLHRLTEVDSPDGGKTTHCYNDAAGSVTTSVLLNSASQWQTNVSYRDGMFHTTRTQLTSDPDSANNTDTVDMTYDGEGKLFTQGNAYRPSALSTDGTSIFYYDAVGRPVETVNQDSSTIQMCYNGLASSPAVYCSGRTSTGSLVGAWVDTTDERSNHWQRVSDGLGRLIQVMEPNGSMQTSSMETDYTFDVLNDLTKVMQYGGAFGATGARSRTFQYDSLGRLISAQNPETGTITYSYLNGSSVCSGDPALPCSKTDARNVKTTYAYDNNNRLIGKTYSDGTFQAVFGWDGYNANPAVSNALGRMFLVSNGYNNSTAYSFDAMGRPTKTYYMLPSVCCASANQVITQAVYDYGGRPTQITYPDGRVLNQVWNNASHLQSVQYASWNGTGVNYNYLSSATYWPDGAPNTLGFGNGVSETISRNRRLQPIEIVAKLGSTNLFDKQICYGPTNDPSAQFCTVAAGNNNGNITRIIDFLNSNNMQIFTYDTLNRLASFVNGGNTMQQTFTIDAWGNLSQSGTMSSILSFDTNNRITTGGYGYDTAGNLTSFNNGISTTTYAFDAESRINNINSGADTYFYGANGDRVRKNVGSAWTEYVYFAGQPIAEKNFNGTWTDYIFAAGQRIAMAASSDQSNPSATTNYYTSDQIGSARMITNGSGGVISSYLFYPFGQGSQPDENHYLFGGKERDSESGLDNFGARYLTSTMGRFMSPDWSANTEPVPYANLNNPQSLNLYAFVQNNPLSQVDRDGHFCSRNGDRTENDACIADAHISWTGPAPRNADGSLKPPPVGLPNGKNGKPNEWVPIQAKSTGATREKWGPKYPIATVSGGQPSASWDDRSGRSGQDHWDIKDGNGGTTRVTEEGKPLSPAEAHGYMTPFDYSPVQCDPEAFKIAVKAVDNFVTDVVDYATHFHPTPGFSPGAAPSALGGYTPVIPPTSFAVP